MILELHSNCRTPFKWELWHICCLSSLGDIIWPLLSRYPGKTFQRKAFNPFIFDCYAYQLNSNGKGIESPLMFTLLREFGWGVLPQQWTLWELLLLHPCTLLPAGSQAPQLSGGVASQPWTVPSTVIGAMKRFPKAVIFHFCVKWVQTAQLVIWERLNLFQSLPSFTPAHRGEGVRHVWFLSHTEPVEMARPVCWPKP